MNKTYGAVGFLFHTAARTVLLHHRDGNALVNPNRWGFFGGSNEDEDAGNPVATWLRELHEELGIVLEAEQVTPFGEGEPSSGMHRYVFYCEWPTLAEDFVLGEGQGFAWFSLDDAVQLSTLTPFAREDLLLFRDRLASLGSAVGLAAGLDHA